MSKDWGSKAGSGGVATASEANVQRRERLRQLALDTIDVSQGQENKREQEEIGLWVNG